MKSNNINTIIVFIFCQILVLRANAQSIFTKKFNPSSAIILDFGVKIQKPFMDMADRYGHFSSLNFNFNYKTKKHWFYSIDCGFMFGSRIKDSSMFDDIDGINGHVIDENGKFTAIDLGMRGLTSNFRIGKLIYTPSKNKNSGIEIQLGLGYMYHKYYIFTPAGVPQLSTEYKKGYDRLSSGLCLSQYIGYRFLDPKKKLNFGIGIESIYAKTEGKRAYDFVLKRPLHDKRTELILSPKFFISIPFYLKDRSEETFFE